MKILLAIFFGGGLGSVCRYLISTCFISYQEKFPWGTLAANLLASIILILSVTYFSQKLDSHPWASQFLLIGFCGGFSTFSTFSLETMRLYSNGQTSLAIGYVSLSLILCIGVMLLVIKTAQT